MQEKIILGLFTLFAIVLVFFIIRLLTRGISILASPPINPAAFLLAKVCAFSSCLFIPLGFFRPDLKWVSVPVIVELAALALLLAGISVAVISMKKLGDDLIFGLPAEGIHSLKKDGIYRFSRNSLYLGFILIILSSQVLTPNPANIAAGVTAILLHHVIVLREEKFLISSLGSAYTDYMKQTGRYLLFF